MDAPILTSGQLSALRVGRFTASIMGKLMTKDRSGKGIGETARTAIAKVAWERRSGRRGDNALTSDMRRGHTLEPIAFALLSEHWTTLKKKYTNEGFFPYGTNAGATPDALAFEGTATVDIKCPACGEKLMQFADQVPDGDLEALKKWDAGYYWQILMQAMCAGVTRCYLVYFDDRWAMYPADVEQFRDLQDTEFPEPGGFAYVARGFDLTEELKKEMEAALEMAEVECTNLLYRINQQTTQAA